MARPRSFEHEKVVTQITDLFWKKGFKGTSIDDLMKSTGLNKATLYSSFGNKEEMFKIAVRHYAGTGEAPPSQLENPFFTLSEFFASIVLEAGLPKEKRRGCLILNSCLEFGNQSERLTPFVLSVGKKREEYFYSLIEAAQKNREIPRSIDKKRAAQRAFATAFTIREMSKFKPDIDFLTEIGRAFFKSIGVDDWTPTKKEQV